MVVILSPTIKPGAELKVSVATLVASEPVVIVGTTERTKEIVFVASVDFATGSLNQVFNFTVTAACVSPEKGVAVETVGAELSVPIVTSVENGALKLNTASAA